MDGLSGVHFILHNLICLFPIMITTLLLASLPHGVPSI